MIWMRAGSPDRWRLKFAYLPVRVGMKDGEPVWVWWEYYQYRRPRAWIKERKIDGFDPISIDTIGFP